MDTDDAFRAQFVRDVRAGLGNGGRKRLPAKYLYDRLGSALFEAITHLPEYGLTRADERVLRRCVMDLPSHFGTPQLLVAELGSGNGTKTRRILESLGSDRVVAYHPIDVSRESLQRCEGSLGDLVPVRPYHGYYADGIQDLRDGRPDGIPLLLLFLGSSIGNFGNGERLSFVQTLRGQLRDGDRLLLGVDLVKPKEMLLRAYDDPTGVTAAFNRNVLGRINRELGSEFDLASFEHFVRYDEQERRIEMHLRAQADQQVRIPRADAVCELQRGETIWTESSYKFDPAQLRRTMGSAGFRQLDAWIDEEWPFMEALWGVDE